VIEMPCSPHGSEVPAHQMRAVQSAQNQLCGVQVSWYHESDYIPSCVHLYQIALCVYSMPCDTKFG